MRIQPKHIVIVGCGRLGGALANQLCGQGHNVVVVDRRDASFDKLSVDFSGFKLIGDAVELHVLQKATGDHTDYLFATTTRDSTNLMVAQIAQYVFHVPHVVARVFDPTREAIYRDFGIQTISPTKLSANAFTKVIE